MTTRAGEPMHPFSLKFARWPGTVSFSPTMAAESVVDVVDRLSCPAAIIGKRDGNDRALARAVEVLKHFCAEKARTFVASAGLRLPNIMPMKTLAIEVFWRRCWMPSLSAKMFFPGSQPILYSYGSDGTPLTSRQRWVYRLDQRHTVHRHGQSLTEFLIQRAHMTYFRGGEQRFFTLVGEPVPLLFGKSAVQQFSAGRVFFPSLRVCGHRHVCLHHFAFDRAGYTALERLFRQLHEAQYVRMAGVPESEVTRLQATDWFISTACCNHDCHNAFRWGFDRHLSKPDLAKQLFLTVESVRNSYDLIVINVKPWLINVVCFSDRKYSQSDSPASLVAVVPP